MEGYCDFCNQKRELVKFKKAMICMVCKANQFRKPRAKVLKSKTEEFTKSMSSGTHADYVTRTSK